MKIAIKKIFFFTALIYLFYSCGSGRDNTLKENNISTTENSAADSNSQKLKIDSGNFGRPKNNSSTVSFAELSLEDLKDSIVLYLKKKDFVKLSTYVHPQKGIRFSPYSYINKTDLIFDANQVKNLMTDKIIYNWGNYDGSGEPIKMDFVKYFRRFIYDKDFAIIKSVQYNDFSNHGTSINNIKEFYPNAKSVHFFYPPSKSGNNMDWAILRLIFELQGGKYYLVGLVHDQWTI